MEQKIFYLRRTMVNSSKMKNFLVLLLLVFSFVLIGCQSDKGKAIANFEAEFEKFHEAYPADEGTYTFKDYSELEKVEENGEVVGYTQKIGRASCRERV